MSNVVDLLPANLQSTLYQVVERTNTAGGGILAILLSTAEGVPLGRIYGNHTAPLNEDVLSSIESTWAPASKQFPLLGLGKEARIATAVYDHGKFIQSACFRFLRNSRTPLSSDRLLVMFGKGQSFTFIRHPW